MRKEEMEEQFNKEAKQGWRFAADAARMTDEIAGSEDRKHTSGEGVVGQNVDSRKRRNDCSRRYAGFCRVLLALGRLDTER